MTPEAPAARPAQDMDPTSRRGPSGSARYAPSANVRAMVPFAAAAVLPLAIAPWTASSSLPALWGAAGLTALIMGLTPALTRRLRFGWVAVVPALIYVAVVALLRHGSGGQESGFGALLLLPVLAIALHGTRSQLTLVVIAATAGIALPIILVGPPLYPDAEWRRLVVLGAVASLTGLAVNELVGRGAKLNATADAARREAAEHALRVTAVVDASSDPILTLDPALRITSWNPAAARLLGLPADAVIGRDAPKLLLGPVEAARMRERYASIRRGQQVARLRFELDVRAAGGTMVPVEVSVLVDPEATSMAVHVVAREIGARRAADALARGHLDDLNELVRVAGTLGALEDAGAVRALMCGAARTLAGADHAILFEPNPTTGLLTPTAQDGQLRIPEVALRPERSRSGRVMQTGAPYFNPDLIADAAADQVAVAAMGVRSAYWQPVIRDGRPIGVVVTYWTTARERLPDRTTRLLALLADQARTAIERAEHLERIAEQATTDPLTGVANRRGMRDALDEVRAHAIEVGGAFSVAIVDLDHFKAYNDAFGHLAGDEFLRSTAAAWTTLLRPDDTLVRYGGEEFLVVLPGCTADVAKRAVDRMRAATLEGRTASAGVAEWDRQEPLAELLGRADIALYRAKAEGRDRTVVSEGR